MRQRRLKDLDSRLEKCSQWMADDAERFRGKWKEYLGVAGGLYLEIGCGKGRFITQHAQEHPENGYLAVEGQASVIVRAAAKLEEAGVGNARLINEYIRNIEDYFADDELDGIYLNFSDPWPKVRHAGRRLTHRRFLESYSRIVKPGGFLEFKTDNDGLFAFTLKEIEKCGFPIVQQTDDLHGTVIESAGCMTEYEIKFASTGKRINYVRFTFDKGGNEMIFAQENNRKMPKEDKIFAISGKAKAMIQEKGKEAVVNATIGALLDDNSDLVVLSSVLDAMKQLKPVDYAEYAPIGGTPAFKEAVKRAAFGAGFKPSRFVEVCATPGGTGAIRNTISNYSKPGDKVLTSDWFWAPYRTISQEIGRDIATYELFDGNGKFNIEGFAAEADRLVKVQGQLVILLNTPAHNPTGYSLSNEDWDQVVKCLNKSGDSGKITLFVDAAYIDFAGDEEEYRSFLPKLEELNDHVLPIIGYSASKTLTLYGMRCGAMICLAKTQEIAAEFKQVTEFSSRGTWSNCVRSAQTLLAQIYDSPQLMEKVGEERAKYRDMLIRRGKTFEKALREEGLENVPFDAGFFTCIACDDPDSLSAELSKEGVFVVPLAKGIRISVASISEEKCVRAAKAIAAAMK